MRSTLEFVSYGEIGRAAGARSPILCQSKHQFMHANYAPFVACVRGRENANLRAPNRRNCLHFFLSPVSDCSVRRARAKGKLGPSSEKVGKVNELGFYFACATRCTLCSFICTLVAFYRIAGSALIAPKPNKMRPKYFRQLQRPAEREWTQLTVK